MLDFIFSVLFQAIIESIPKFLGTSIRWCYFLGQKKFSVVFEEAWNRRVGVFALGVIVALLIW